MRKLLTLLVLGLCLIYSRIVNAAEVIEPLLELPPGPTLDQGLDIDSLEIVEIPEGQIILPAEITPALKRYLVACARYPDTAQLAFDSQTAAWRIAANRALTQSDIEHAREIESLNNHWPPWKVAVLATGLGVGALAVGFVVGAVAVSIGD